MAVRVHKSAVTTLHAEIGCSSPSETSCGSFPRYTSCHTTFILQGTRAASSLFSVRCDRKVQIGPACLATVAQAGLVQ